VQITRALKGLEGTAAQHSFLVFPVRFKLDFINSYYVLIVQVEYIAKNFLLISRFSLKKKAFL